MAIKIDKNSEKKILAEHMSMQSNLLQCNFNLLYRLGWLGNVSLGEARRRT